jgi:N-acetylneuraminic acid mutarotase
MNHSIFYFGGQDAEFIRDNNWKFDLLKNEWKNCKKIPTPRSEMGCAQNLNKIYCFGGWLGEKNGPTEIAEVYDLLTDSWDSIPFLPHPLISVKAIATPENIYILGGTLGETQSYFYKYSISDKKYTPLKKMNIQRIHGCMEKIGDKIYFLGGNSFKNGAYTIHQTVEEYSISTNTWRVRKPIPHKIMNSSSIILNHEIHLIGGKNLIGDHKEGLTNYHFIFNPLKNEWRIDSELPFYISNHNSIVYQNKIILLGGSTDFPNPTKVVRYLDYQNK